jgi:predicted RNase H-like HicB family nuclease
MKAMKLRGLKTVVWKEGKYYVALALNVDVSSFGKTKKEALDNLREALELFVDTPELAHR